MYYNKNKNIDARWFMIKKEWYRASSSGREQVYSCAYIVENPKGIVQIAHGMCEHMGRYDAFAQVVAQSGYIVCGNDHLGHGHSQNNHPGVFTDGPHGFAYVIEDVHNLFVELSESEEAYTTLPLILLGHSMGSILAALFAEKYDYLDALILMGTPTTNPMVGAAEYILKRSVEKHGYRYKSNLFNRVMWGPEKTDYESKRKNRAWLSYDTDNIETAIRDELSDFAFCDSANLEMVHGLKMWGKPNWGTRIPKIPILVIAGADDRIGGNGKGPRYHYNKLKARNHDVELKIIEKNRHEILNETNRLETYEYLLQWFDGVIGVVK